MLLGAILSRECKNRAVVLLHPNPNTRQEVNTSHVKSSQWRTTISVFKGIPIKTHDLIVLASNALRTSYLVPKHVKVLP